MRNVFASLLFLGALVAGLVGSVLHWGDYVARSPEPTVRLAQSIMHDEAVINAISDQLQSAVDKQLPEVAKQIPGLRDRLPELVKRGVDAATSDDQAQATWQSVLDETRRTLVTDLTQYNSRQTSTVPSVWVKLDPLVDLVWKNVKESADPATQALLANVQVPQNVRVKATDLTHSQADSIGQALNLVSYWGIAYLVAAVLLVAGMLLGTKRARWVMLIVFPALGTAGVSALQHTTMITFNDPSSQLATTLGNRVATQLSGSLATWLDGFKYLCVALQVVGIVGTVIAVNVYRRRRMNNYSYQAQ